MLDRRLVCPCYRHEQDIADTGHCICHLFVNDAYQPVELDPPPVRGENSPWPIIVIYGAFWCRDTVRTLALLNHQGIPYTYIDIEYDPQGAERVQEWNQGRLSTPTLDIEGRIVSVPSDEALLDLLGLPPAG